MRAFGLAGRGPRIPLVIDGGNSGGGGGGGTGEVVVEEPVVTDQLVIVVSREQISVGNTLTTSENGNIKLTELVVLFHDVLGNIGTEIVGEGYTINSSYDGEIYIVTVDTTVEMPVPVEINYTDILVVTEIVEVTKYITDPLTISWDATQLTVGAGSFPAVNNNIAVSVFELEGTDILALAGTDFSVGTLNVTSTVNGSAYSYTITPQSADTQISYVLNYTDEGEIPTIPEPAEEGEDTAFFSDDMIVTEHATGGQEIGTYTKAGKTLKYHLYKSSAKFDAVQKMSTRTLMVGPGGGGPYSNSPIQYYGSGAAGGCVVFTRVDFKAGDSETIVIGAGASGSNAINSHGGHATKVSCLGQTFAGGMGGYSYSYATSAPAIYASSAGISAADKNIYLYPVAGQGHRGGETVTTTTSTDCRLGAGGGGAGGRGGDADYENRTSGAAGPGLDLSKIFPFLDRAIFGCGAAGTAQSIDGADVFQGAAAEGGSEHLTSGAPNSGNAGGSSYNNSSIGNGGSGFCVIVYRIA